MSLNTDSYEKKQSPIPPQGPQVAVCYSIIDLGTHMRAFMQQDPKPTKLLQISWELPNLPFTVFKEGEQPKPYALFQEYTTSLGDKAKLPKLLESWRGQPVKDLAKELPIFLGQPCLVNVEYNKDKQRPDIIYANVGMKGLGIMRLPVNTPVNPLTNPKTFFDLDHYSHAQYLLLPKWIQKKIQSSLEWTGIIAKYGPVPVQPQTQVQQNNTNFQQQGQQQGFGSQQQGFNNQAPVNNANTQPQNNQGQGFQTTHTIPNPNTQQQQNNGVGFGGEVVHGNPFENPPF